MDEGGTRGSQRGELHELIGKCTSCLLCTPAIQQRDRGDQRVNQGQSERQWDCGRGSCRGHRMGLGRINWNALFRMVYSVLVEWNASSLTRAMAGGAGHCSHRAESAGYQKHSEGTRKVNAPARASLKLGADGPAACSTGEATRMPPRPTADGLVVLRMVLSGDFVFHLLAAAVSGIAWAW